MKINENVFNKELHYFASSARFKGKAKHLKYAHAHTHKYMLSQFPVLETEMLQVNSVLSALCLYDQGQS